MAIKRPSQIVILGLLLGLGLPDVRCAEPAKLTQPEKPEPHYRKLQPKYGVSKKKQRR